MNELGNISQDKNMYILKKYARIGQAFSTTKQIIEIQKEKIITIPDIERPYVSLEREDKIFVFTDGCGNISQDLADIINEEF